MIKSISKNTLFKTVHVMYESGNTRLYRIGKEPKSVKDFMKEASKINLSKDITCYRR